MQRLSGDVRCVVACKEERARGDFVGLSGRPIGTSDPNVATLSAGNVDGMSGVQIGPGAIALTRMFCCASDIESERVNATIAPFVAE